KSTIYVFSILALFLLLIASFNFINLTLAQQSKRTREVGIRKTLGGSRRSLIVQFLAESLFITLIGVVFGMVLTELFMGKFNEISGKEVHITDVFQPTVMLVLIGVIILVGGLAGAYPPLVLSAARPADVLAGQKSGGGRVGILRKTLILLQFLF